MTDTTPIVTLARPEIGRGLPRGVLAAIAVSGLLLIAALAAWAGGVRIFVVESPSMGTTAPVGSLVIGSARPEAAPAVGDLITFQPPEAGATPYTHRIVGGVSGGFRTKGDINGVADPWTVTPAMVIARTAAVVPGAGWVVKAAPFLLAGLVAAQIAGLFVRAPARRWSIRTAALAVAIAFVCWAVRPFSGFVLLQSHLEQDGLRATVVSTALLPIRVTAAGGGHVDLLTGQVGRITLPPDIAGRVALTSQLQLDPSGWALVALVCLVPVLAVLVVGVPVEDAADAAA